MEALIIVDVQYDFMPGGALAAQEGDVVVPVINSLMKNYELIVATQDWHPPDHKSFASNHGGKNIGDFIKLKGMEQILWPDHCIQNTWGAELHADLDQQLIKKIFKKGIDPVIDSYSGFFDNGHLKSTGMGEYLEAEGVDTIHVVGLATDYCVKFTVMDACKKFNFKVQVIKDATKAVNLKPTDFEEALEEMKNAGAEII
ncbi:MAG TPA: bifunctional nicotinamidase/pyrazinamidase [Cyclobacteriaceae bacterium]